MMFLSFNPGQVDLFMFSVGFGTRFITVVGDQGAKQQIKLQIWDTVSE